jgi:hypothetical protein
MVEALLGMEEQTNWWEPIRKLFVEADGSLVSHLNEKFEIPDEIGGVTTLRRLDVILWMESRARQMSPRRTSSAEHPTQN